MTTPTETIALPAIAIGQPLMDRCHDRVLIVAYRPLSVASIVPESYLLFQGPYVETQDEAIPKGKLVTQSVVYPACLAGDLIRSISFRTRRKIIWVRGRRFHRSISKRQIKLRTCGCGVGSGRSYRALYLWETVHERRVFWLTDGALKEGLLHDPISRGCEYPSRLVRLTPREASARVHCGRASAQFEFRGHFLPRTDDSQHPHRC